MLRNELRITFRHLRRKWLYTAMNIAGLAVGISGMLLALLYVRDEGSYDRFHRKNPHLYRITTTLIEGRGQAVGTYGGTGQVQGPAFKAAVPEVVDYARVMGGDIFGNLSATNHRAFNLRLLFVDSTFFNIFSFRLLTGDPKTALQRPGNVVITESTARKFFGSTDVLGRTLLEDGPSGNRLGASVITGVVQDPPRHSSIQFDVLFPFRFMQASFDDTNWLNAYLGTFVVLHPQADLPAVIRKFNRIYAVRAREQRAESRRNGGFDPKISYGLQAMTDIHLNPLERRQGNREGGIVDGSSPVFSYLFLGIAAFILLMASINFINLSLAGSLNRAKEVGIRKINGGRRSRIVGQFLIESAVQCLAAFALALAIAGTALPVFNRLAGKAIEFSAVFDGRLLIYLPGLLVSITLLAGLYPALVLSGFRPVEVLYNRQKGAIRSRFGRALVVVQFSLTIFLLTATLVYYRQMEFVRTKDLGYNPYEILRAHIPGSRDLKPIQSFLRNRLAGEPSIRHLSFGGEIGGENETRVGGRTLLSGYQYVDEQFIPALEIPLKAGRAFSTAFLSDATEAVVVNEAFVKAAGLRKPLGALVHLHSNYGGKPLRIIGVVQDFHARSLRERIRPMALFMRPDQSGGIWLKIDKNRRKEALAVWEKAFKAALPNAVFEYRFLDEQNAGDYALERRWQQIIGYAAGLAVLISGLGLFGLAHLAARQRTKEIGIRKVLGASVESIVALLTKEFLILVLLALLLASPVAAFVMNRWLEGFAYRVPLEWWLFAAIGGLAVGIAFLTVSFQSLRAALMNPVKSLRSE
ncbi:FtsX-like permease family protein [Larkinella soli]|uniref:FtsX-like permease family protein n=1 Tax=Larkinella soli TaxID=1770527 RepID=UPI0013E30ABE|nr:FtsX-like permease family protein [Larkinella soli]